ncbi:tRNA-splicing endonuclease subunit Sen2-1 [Linum perenne]
MSPRWKGKGAEAKALADPMSKIVSGLQSFLLQSDAHGSLSGSSVLLQVELCNAELLTRACFGRPIATAVRLCGSVAKTLLVIHINKNGHGDVSAAVLDGYSVEERTIKRWSAERSREEDQLAAK